MPKPPKSRPAEIRDALTGPVPSLRTPFTRDGAIDRAALQRQIDAVIQAGAKAVMLTWGDSLYSLLTDDEIAELTRAVVEITAGRAKVIAADNSWWTGKLAEFAGYCADVGADLLMVKPPDWAGSTHAATLVPHYAAAAEHIPVMVVTNFLHPLSLPAAIDVIETLYANVPGIVAVKDDLCGEFARKLCLVTHERWAIIAGGLKQNHMNMFPYGVDGFLSTHIIFKPDVTSRYWAAVERSDVAEMAAIIRDLDMPLFDYVKGVRGGFDAAIHGMLELVGLGERWRRPPYHSLTNEEMAELARFLNTLGFGL